MTASSQRRLTAFLLSAGFLVAALAIIVGIFGMHVMTGAHDMGPGHSMTAAGGGPVVQLQTMPVSHSHKTMTDGAAEAPAVVTGSSASSCAPAGSCPEMTAGAAACVLAPGTTTLAAPLPGTASYELPDFGAAAAATRTYSYSPDSPSPGDLCISRT
ncbi:hypothetical protein [Pseudarthrobacter oxydans]|uniref:hypothetical protein n=1 Tax=Pseudarthrobacter oxydans TaxID=1671 RepID=UPI0035E98541|nr:hypothetical protein GCM10017547_34890 [Pseudarthrobacter oxydans]